MFLPVSLHLSGKRVIVIGGGDVAERKVDSLLAAGATVRVVSPQLTPHLEKLAGEELIEVYRRPYSAGDCKGAFLVIAATDNREIQQAVWKEAEEHSILINTVDEMALSNVIMPSVVRQGDLTVAISTGGKSPALAVRLRERLESTLGPEYGRLLELLGELRPQLQLRFSDANVRKRIQYRIVDSEILGLLRLNEIDAAKALLNDIIESFDHTEVSG